MIPSNFLLTESPTLTDGVLRLLAAQVRQTLHEVLGSMELMSDQSFSQRQIAQLSRCGESLHALLRVANDCSELVDFTSTGERSCTFSVADLLGEFGDLVGVRAARKGLHLRWSVDRTIPNLVLGYRTVLEAALYRLVDNSLEFTGEGEIAISAKMRKRDIQFGELAIEISDTGPGLPEDALRDFQYGQGESQAIGLGLRLARKQLTAIGGGIEVVSSGERGTTLAILFPVTLPAGEAVVEPLLDDRCPHALLRLLVAEDSDDSFAVFESFVEDEGHQLTRALNGAEAVEMFKSGDFDLVVMDVNMPVMDGYSATQAIREWETQAGRARRPILLLSADDAGRQKRIGSAVGCSGYLTKPTPKRELVCALRSYSRPIHFSSPRGEF